MADNVSITPGTGSPIATDEISGVHYQRVKLTYGGDGTATDVSEANALPVAPNTFNKKLRDAFQTYPGSNWTTVSAGVGDLVQIDGNAGGASYLVISKDPWQLGTSTVVESTLAFGMPIELAVGASMSQRTLGQQFSIELVSTEAPGSAPAELAISSIQQATTTLTVTTATAHNLVAGQRIGIYGVKQDSRLNYSTLVVATTPSVTQFTATAGPGGTIPSLTVGPFASGSVYLRSALNYSPNGSAMLFENATATNASFYVKSEGGDAVPIGGTIAGNHSVTISTSVSVQAINSALNYAFRPTTEYRLSTMADKVQWQDGAVDVLTQASARATFTQITPSPDQTYKIRFRAENFKGLTVPVAQIVSVSKSGATTATVVCDRAHGLTTGDYINSYGVRDQTNFANLTTATVVASVVNSTTFTVVWGTAVTATSYGGLIARANGGQTLQGAITQVVQSAAISSSILTLVGNASWSGLLIGDYINASGLRDNTTGVSLNIDGAFRVRDIQTTNLILEALPGTTIPSSLVSTNCGGAVLKRTDMRISFVRLFEYERVRVETMSRPSGDIASAAPVQIANNPAVAQSGAWAVNVSLPALVSDVASAAITTTTTAGPFTPTFGAEYEINIPVTAVSGTTPTLDVVIQESDDSGTNWYDVWHMERITATGIYRSPKLVLKGNRVRYVQTVSGTSPSFTRIVNRLQGSATGIPMRRRLLDRTLNVNSGTPNTAALNVAECNNLQLIVNMGAITTTPPVIKLQMSEDNVTWMDVPGGSVTTVASTTVQATVANIQTQFVRAIVGTTGSGATLGFIAVKGWS